MKEGFNGGASESVGGSRFVVLNMENDDIRGENQGMSNQEDLIPKADKIRDE